VGEGIEVGVGEGIVVGEAEGIEVEIGEGIGGVEAVPEDIGVGHDLEEHRELVEEHIQGEGVEDHILEEQRILPGVVEGEEVQSEASVVSVALVRVLEVRTLAPWEFLPRGWGSRGTG